MSRRYYLVKFKTASVEEINAKIPDETLDRKFLWSCAYGNLDSVKFFINQGVSNYNDGLSHACEYGHSSVARFLLRYATNFEKCIITATRNGHNAIVQMLSDYCSSNKLYACLQEALYYAHIKTAMTLIEKGACDIQKILNILTYYCGLPKEVAKICLRYRSFFNVEYSTGYTRHSIDEVLRQL
jgi:hypothetical protein